MKRQRPPLSLTWETVAVAAVAFAIWPAILILALWPSNRNGGDAAMCDCDHDDLQRDCIGRCRPEVTQSPDAAG
jgi:hypothetical protein